LELCYIPQLQRLMLSRNERLVTGLLGTSARGTPNKHLRSIGYRDGRWHVCCTCHVGAQHAKSTFTLYSTLLTQQCKTVTRHLHNFCNTFLYLHSFAFKYRYILYIAVDTFNTNTRILTAATMITLAIAVCMLLSKKTTNTDDATPCLRAGDHT
jgi:hypothetical protein